MADVFISYHDKTEGILARNIAKILENKGIRCWYAKRDVSAGDDFAHEVITQIENCKVFLLLLDDGAAHSSHVENEVANAFGRKKIMPYQTDKKDVKNVPWVRYYLKQIQIVPLPNLYALAEEIAGALGRPVKSASPTYPPETKAKNTALAEGVGGVLMLLCVIAGIRGGFLFGGSLGSYLGYYVGWAFSYAVMLVTATLMRIKNIAESNFGEFAGFLGMALILAMFIEGQFFGFSVGLELRQGIFLRLVFTLLSGYVHSNIFVFLIGVFIILGTRTPFSK
ncbi:MAG: toll/interleukin-1 receptor domain-containing protein [Oscillibacter sp.]|nr:toll/interleukin-1 receptor domain-containing protein [Oscillibacter sp.]